MAISRPKVQQRSGPSIVWIIPVVTLIVGGWLVVKTLREQGPVVTVSFRTADGIEADKTRVKYKNVDIGMVEKIGFSEDLSNVIVRARFNKGTENFFRRNTRFWVVRPELSLRGASGLSTLISGAYIEIEPGKGAPQSHFVGLEKQPVVTADVPGRRIVLSTTRLHSIDTGSPIYYHGIKAGEVLGYDLANDSQSVFIDAFIKDPYDQLLRANTHFWNVSGLDVSVNADGLEIRTESLQSLMFGGIAFETPISLEPASDDVEELVFTLFDDYKSIEETAYTKKLRYVMFFDNSVRGLTIGAPVEFKGIKVGSVLDIRLEYDESENIFRIPVLVEIESERIIQTRDVNDETAYTALKALVDQGMRARLQTGSLLTGQLYVELGMFPDTPVRFAAQNSEFPELPTIPSANLESITQSAQRFLAKLDSVRIDAIGDELLATLRGANKLVNSEQLEASVTDLRGSLMSLRSILSKLDESNLDQAVKAAHAALEKFNTTLELGNRLLDPNSPLHYNLIQAISEIEETARAVRTLVETLERQPQAVIFGKEDKGDDK